MPLRFPNMVKSVVGQFETHLCRMERALRRAYCAASHRIVILMRADQGSRQAPLLRLLGWFSPTKDLRFADVESAAGKPPILRLRRPKAGRLRSG